MLPAVIIVGGAVYVLESAAPPTALPPVYTGGANGSGWNAPYDPMGLVTQAPTGQSAKIDALLSAGFAKFQQMTDSEKAQAAATINADYNPQPPLTGRETWNEIAASLGGAVGGAYGGPLGAIAGAYLGTTLESWLASSVDDVENWLKQNVPGAVDSITTDLHNWLGF